MFFCLLYLNLRDLKSNHKLLKSFIFSISSANILKSSSFLPEDQMEIIILSVLKQSSYQHINFFIMIHRFLKSVANLFYIWYVLHWNWHSNWYKCSHMTCSLMIHNPIKHKIQWGTCSREIILKIAIAKDSYKILFI